MIILGIETSCDETSAAVLADGRLRSNVISTQLVHTKYGGIVPELASRAHQKLIVPVVDEALTAAGVAKEDLSAVAVTSGPGLMGALLVGLNFGKSLAFGLRIPAVGVNHMHGHIYSNFLDEPVPEFPFLCLIVSGGHTQLMLVRAPFRHELLGETLDDAAGEAYDKVGKMLGLGFPGGPVIDRRARNGNPAFVRFPRSLADQPGYAFSFSGVKTSVLYYLRDHGLADPATGAVSAPDALLDDLCASFQAAVVDVLVEKTFHAAAATGVRHVAVAGGVSANSELRRRMAEEAAARGLALHVPRFEFCTDNGAMIAMAGAMRLRAGLSTASDLAAFASGTAG
jgi:N6-L-threonylcarbamoyladenine synthase